MEHENQSLENLQSRFNFFNKKVEDHPFHERLNNALKIALSFATAPALLKLGFVEIQSDALTGTIMIATSAILFLFGSYTTHKYFEMEKA